MELVKITYEVKAILSNTKSGIGYYQKYIIETMLKSHTNYHFSLDCMSIRNNDEKYQKLLDLSENKQNYKINIYYHLPYSIYQLVCLLVPIPFKWFFKDKTDISHFFNYYLPPGLSGKKVVTIYDMVIREYPETMKFQTKLMLRLNLRRSIKKSDCIITISEFSKREIMKYYDVPEDKIEIVYCGISTDHFKKSTDMDQVSSVLNKYNIKRNYFLYLGTLEPRKNIENLVKAYDLFLSNNDDKTQVPLLVIAGGKGWAYQSIYDLVKKLKLDNQVIFTGYVSDDEAPILMSNAYAFCYPSLYEGFGMPPLEAMACGVPVITSNVASLPEVAGDAAIYVDPYSVDSIESALQNIFENKEKRDELIQLGYKRVKLFSWENSCKKLNEIYKNLCAK